MKRIKTLLKLNIILMLVSYLFVYIMPLGIYYAERYVREQDGNGFFYYDRLFLLVIVGVGCSICLVSFAFIRNKNSEKSFIITLILSILHIFVIMAGKYFVFEIARYVAAYEGTFETYMSGAGKLLYILIAIVNVIVLVLAIVGVIFCYINESEQMGDREDSESITELPTEIVQFRKLLKIVNDCFLGGVSVLFMLLAVAAMVLEIDNLGIIAIVLGILIPFAIYIIVFYNKWIKNGRWTGVILTYMGLIYYAYNMIFYLFEDSIGMTLKYVGLGEGRFFAFITMVLVVMMIIIAICCIIDKRMIKNRVKENIQ